MTLTRRRMLAGLGAFVATAATLPTRWSPWAWAAPGDTDDPVRAVLRSYVSTLVPGPAEDPRGTPGAAEAEAVEQLLVQVPYIVPMLVADLMTSALAATGQAFTSLTYAEREALLVEAFADPVRSPYHLIALAVGAGSFYGDFRNDVGGSHLGFPGPSDGYLHSYTDRTGHGQPEGSAVPV